VVAIVGYQNISLRVVNELIRAGKLSDARGHVESLKASRPELARLYESKLEEIRKAASPLTGTSTLDKSQTNNSNPAKNYSCLRLEQIIFITATCRANEAKRQAIDATWGNVLRKKRVRHYYVIGIPELDRSYRLNQTIYVPCRDDYESLLLKLALAYEYLLNSGESFSHVFKIDDDCYVNVEVLESLLAETPAEWDYIAGAMQSREERINRRWHFGKCSDSRFDVDYPRDYPPASYAKGGYGYILSRRALEVVAQRIPVFRRELEGFIYSYEDLRLGEIFAEEDLLLRQLSGYVVAAPSASSARGVSVVYDIPNVLQFYRYHQELAADLLCGLGPKGHLAVTFTEDSSIGDYLGFDNIYLVNLRSAVGRRTATEWILNREGIRYELFNAFDGQSVLGKSIFRNISARPVGELERHPQYSSLEMRRGSKFIDSAGAVGYIISYIRIILDAKQRGFKKVLLLEDDVLLRRNFRAHFARFIGRVGPDYKVLLLGASQYGWDSVDVPRAETEGYYLARPLDTCGSFAIAVDLSIADDLIDELLSFEGPFDHIPLGSIYEKFFGACYVAYPNIVIPDVSDSHIRGARDQLTHSKKMRWRLEDFDYPFERVRLGVVLCQGAELKSLPDEEFNIDLFCYQATPDGLRPIHYDGRAISKPMTEVPSFEAVPDLSRGSYILPVEKLFATTRSCDGSELALEALSAPARFGARDGRSREWLHPLQNSPQKAKAGHSVVVIPTKGRIEPLVKAVESVLNQEYQDKEVIVVDENPVNTDCAQFVDNFVSKLQKSGERVRLIRHAQPRNAAAARNTGLFATNAEFVSFLDDDDMFLPGRLSRVIEVLKESGKDVGGAYCGYLGWNSKINDITRYPTDQIPRRLLTLDFRSHYVCTDTVTYRREALLSVNGYDECFRRHQDLELNIRIFRTWKIAALPEPLVQLNPLPADNSNKLFDVDLFDIKSRFLSKFEGDLGEFGLDKESVLIPHVREMINFTRDKDRVVAHALGHPSIFSSAYLKEVLLHR
jgi:glycosyltransferase involved in cell wall biosynthesis